MRKIVLILFLENCCTFDEYVSDLLVTRAAFHRFRAGIGKGRDGTPRPGSRYFLGTTARPWFREMTLSPRNRMNRMTLIINQYFNPNTPVAQKIADGVVFDVSKVKEQFSAQRACERVN